MRTFDASGSGYAVCGASAWRVTACIIAWRRKTTGAKLDDYGFFGHFRPHNLRQCRMLADSLPGVKPPLQRHVSDDDADGSSRRPSRPGTTHIPTRRWFPPGVYHTRSKSTEFPEASCRRARPTPGFYLGGWSSPVNQPTAPDFIGSDAMAICST
jgi:hypothetical protein